MSENKVISQNVCIMYIFISFYYVQVIESAGSSSIELAYKNSRSDIQGLSIKFLNDEEYSTQI